MHALTKLRLPLALRALRRFDFPHKLGLCERLFGKGIAGHGVCWVDTAARRTWKLDMGNPTHRWMVYGEYEGGAFLAWARNFLPRDGMIVDSGANIGQMAAYLAQYVPNGCVLAFEPTAEAADWLEECLASNPDLPVEVIRLGVGDRAGRSYIRSLGSDEIHGAWNQISESEGSPIEVVTLDDFLARKGVGRIDLWKLDVEGHELNALRGAGLLLRRKAIGAIYVELAFGNGPAIVDYLGGLGYRAHLFDRAGRLRPLADLPAHTNGLFLPDA